MVVRTNIINIMLNRVVGKRWELINRAKNQKKSRPIMPSPGLYTSNHI